MNAAHYFFLIGVLMSLWFGFRFNMRVLSHLARFKQRRRKRRHQIPDPIIDLIAHIELKDTLVRDAFGTAAGLSAALISLSFW
jgi:hypothetical protein